MSNNHINTIKDGLTSKVSTFITGALLFVAGLAWNDAIQSTINAYLPDYVQQKQNALGKLIYAFVVTIIAIIIISFIMPNN